MACVHSFDHTVIQEGFVLRNLLEPVKTLF